jgi:hypothetical protein
MTTRAASLSAWFDDSFGSTADQDACLRFRLAVGAWVVYHEREGLHKDDGPDREDAMDHRGPILGLIVLCLCTATPTVAQDKRALIEKLMEVSNISGQIQSGTQGVTAQIMTQIKKNNPTIPEDVSAYVQEKIENKLSTILATIVNQLGYQVYSENLSTDELQSVIDFYSSETGQKLVKKLPILIQKTTTQLPEYLKGVGPKIRETAIGAAAEKKYHLEF